MTIWNTEDIYNLEGGGENIKNDIFLHFFFSGSFPFHEILI